MVPNEVFSKLSSLSEKELKVLLIILRQTIGWKLASGKRKHRDWISTRFFMRTTGLSSKSVSTALTLLIKKKLILAETSDGKLLSSVKARKASQRTFYRCLLINHKPKVKSSTSHRNILPTTKLTDTKLSNMASKKIESSKRLTDYQRYLQIIGP